MKNPRGGDDGMEAMIRSALGVKPGKKVDPPKKPASKNPQNPDHSQAGVSLFKEKRP